MPEAANLEDRYLEQGAKPKARHGSKKTKASKKTSSPSSSAKSADVKSASQKSATTQDMKGKVSESGVKSSAEVESVGDVGKDVSDGKLQSSGFSEVSVSSTAGAEDVDKKQKSDVVAALSGTVPSKSSVPGHTEIKLSDYQVESKQSTSSKIPVSTVETTVQTTDIGVVGTTDTLSEAWQEVSHKSSKRKNKKKLTSVESSATAAVTSTVGITDIAGATGVATTDVEPVGKRMSGQEHQEPKAGDQYLKQGARPKIRVSKGASSTNDVGTKTSDGKKGTVASGTAVQEEPSLKYEEPALVDVKSDQKRAGVLSSVKVVSPKRHMVFSKFFEEGKEYVSLSEHTKKVREFRSGVEDFASMHMEYCINAIFGTFSVEQGKLKIKSNVQQMISSLTEKTEMCIFMIKIAALDHWLSRVANINIQNSIKYCASHWDDQSRIDMLLLDILKLGVENVRYHSRQTSELLQRYGRSIGKQNVFKLHSRHFYEELLKMYNELVDVPVQDLELKVLRNRLLLSCMMQFGRMYRVLHRVKQTIPKHKEKPIFFKGKMVEHYSPNFSYFCCHLRNTMSHLYDPGRKNFICTVHGLKYPSSLNVICDFRGLILDIQQHVDSRSMCFGVFIDSMVSRVERYLSSKMTLALVEQDILRYSVVVLSRYSTLGEDVRPSYEL
ncbi:DUF3514 domain-containing protein [Ehrlichia minasensis]|uniref:DUF3514 domain-containing protein n=1 Tax=Ehrlichia minasensis TaxID=1242993 RepID=A0A4Q6I3K2_9RICK|nr:DUF3514 domain-containing protein [Ehrlichia minasensis]RZB12411.1 DUF3514 domain-containing protein [Ehrlichia minasensis]